MLKNQLCRVFVFLYIIFCALDVCAQDIHFSQYNQSPLHVNPAYTGMFEGNWRFTNNYRNQWSAVGTPYKTISASFDKPFKLRTGNIGLGIYVLNDQSGSAKLTTNKILLSLSYNYNIKKNKFYAGIQAGYTIQSYNIDPLTFPGQYNTNTGYFDGSLPMNLEDWDENINYSDINIGIAWSSDFHNIKPTIGFCAYHINNPKLSFLRDDDSKLAPRFAINASTYIQLKNEWYARPELLCNFQKSAKNNLAGGIIGYKFPLEMLLDRIYAGTQIRTQFHSTDALVATFGVALMGLDIGLSYDVNVSGFRHATNMRGAFELSLVYTNFISDLKRITIPCDRY